MENQRFRTTRFLTAWRSERRLHASVKRLLLSDCEFNGKSGGSPQLVPTSFRGAGRRKGDRLDLGEVELAGGVVDIEPDDIAVCVEIDDKAFDNLPRLDAWGAFELDIKTVRLGIIVQFHRASLLKLRSKSNPGTASRISRPFCGRSIRATEVY